MTPRLDLLKIHDRISSRDMAACKAGTDKIITGSVSVEKAKLYWTCFYGETEEAYIFTSIDEKTWRLDKKCRKEALETELKSILFELSNEALKNELIVGWRGDNQWLGSWDYANDQNK